jgi:hypothetical protein
MIVVRGRNGNRSHVETRAVLSPSQTVFESREGLLVADESVDFNLFTCVFVVVL